MFYTNNVILPLLDLSVNANIFFVGYIFAIFFVIIICLIVDEIESVFGVVVIGIIVGIVLSVTAKTDTTDKISEAKTVNTETFSEKVIKTGKLEKLSSNSKEAISDTKVSSLKNSYIDLSGVKDGKKVNLIVEFDKDDTMTVKVSKDGEKADEENYESFEYAPKQ